LGVLVAEWTFLSNHGLVLLCIAGDPGVRLRDVGDRVGITERAAHRIVSELVEAGYLEREREGRRNRYEISHDRPLPDPLASDRKLGELLAFLASKPAS
jgi:DNA-binding transcriptional ArsR family regulator